MKNIIVFTFLIFFCISSYAQDPIDRALNYLDRNQDKFGWTELDLKDLILSDNYTSKHNGVRHLYFNQQLNGIKLHNGISNLNLSPEGTLLNINNRFVSDLENKVNLTEAVIAIEEAIVAAAEHLGIYKNQSINILSSTNLPDQQMELISEISDEIIKANLVYVELKDHSAVRLAWNFVIDDKEKNDVWSIQVDAQNAEVLNKHNFVLKCSFDHPTGNVCSTKCPSETSIAKATAPIKSLAAGPNEYNVFPIPVESPIHGERAIVNSPWLLAGEASPLGWHSTGLVDYPNTRGNNVIAKEDLDGDNMNGYSPESETLDFDFPFNPTGTNAYNLDAAITNLFYWCNSMHDVWYNYGFDEVAGNFQQNNRGLGGIGNDLVIADAQDGEDTNNANFSSAQDGSMARIQMFLWSSIGGTPALDSDFDNGIICHEYGHGLTVRMTGGPSSGTCLIGDEQMGEGWSDWFGLMMTMKESDSREMGRGAGNYLLNQSINGTGTRPARYSTSTNINDYTYESVSNTALNIPWDVGFIWATVLWEMTWDLIDTYGYDPDLFSGTGGNNLAMQLVIDGIKMGPCNPGMVDGRDAILLADRVNNDGANQCLIWDAFARRGLGYGADQGSPNLRNDQTASFDLPPACKEISFEFKAENDSIPANGLMAYNVKLKNNKGTVANDVEVQVTIPNFNTFFADSSNCQTSITGDVLSLNFGTLEINETVECQFYLKANYPKHTQDLFIDDHESGTENWELSNNSGLLNWLVTEDAFSGESAWQAPGTFASSTQYLESAYEFELQGDNIVLRVFHKYNNSKGWDGGLIEYSLNGGNSWMDFDNEDFILNGYNRQLASAPSSDFNFSSTIGFKEAFSGRTNGYINSIIDLNDLEDENVKFRFHYSNNNLFPIEGWTIDDFQILDAVFMNIEACLMAEGQDDVCLQEMALVTEEVENSVTSCLADPGRIEITISNDNGLIEVNQGSPGIIQFENVFSGEVPDENYSVKYFVSRDDEVKSIYERLTNAQLNLINFDPGEYIIWAVSYGEINGAIDIEEYFLQNFYNTMTQIINAANADLACMNVTNRDVDGNTVRLTVRSTTGLNDLKNSVNNIQINPNPVIDELNLSFYTNENKKLNIEIFNIKGQLNQIKSMDCLVGENQIKIPTRSLASGTYLLKISDDKGHYLSEKFVKD